MHYKPIENYHVENVVLGKDFNLGMIGSFFHAFTHPKNVWIFTFIQFNPISCI